MSNITKSASKIVLLYIVFILGLITVFSVVWDIVHGQFSEVTKIVLASFGSANSFLFGFYFANKGESGEAYGGK